MRRILLYSLLGIVGHLSAQPVALHPDNPHYLTFHGSPTLLITSAEHYGAVLNADFDYRTYLESLSAEGMNYTRIFSGSYVEIPGSFGIQSNVLAPAVGEYLAPWQRVEEAGLYEGEGKFDLSKWNPDYFDRLRDFVSVAASHDIIVELTFFCATYDDDYWLRHPFHPGNNVNQLGTLARQDFNTLKNEQVVQFQKALIRKMVAELNEFDNLFYEISNEPWADNDVKKLNLLKTSGASRPEMKWSLYSHAASEEALAWQQVMASEIEDAEKNLHKKHLIAQNYCNYKQSLEAVDANIDIIHFHYAWPEAVALNYGWDRPIGFDESGFAGSADSTYLQQAWSFMLAGGAIFNNLDYSYYVGSEDGTGSYDAPGGGSKRLRQQLKILHGFMDSFDYINMQPDYSVIYHAPGMISQSLSQPGIQYAIFFQGNAGDWVKLSLPEGEYQYEWIAPDTGQSLAQEEIQGSEDPVTISVPGHGYRFALRILSR